MRADVIASYIKLRNVMYGCGSSYGTQEGYELLSEIRLKLVKSMSDSELTIAQSIREHLRCASEW